MLELCLASLARQTLPVAEVLIVHCGNDEATESLANDQRWVVAGLHIRYFHYPERNAAQQRNFAVGQARYDNLLLLDDDVEVEPFWVEELFKPLWADVTVGATMGRLMNQPMAAPTAVWRLYRRVLYRGNDGFTPGRLVGAALPNGFPTDLTEPIRCEWIGGGCSAIRRQAYQSVGGFAPFFTGSSPGEDLDLGYRLSRHWQVYYVPTARCVHHQAPSGRERSDRHQYLSMRARFGILNVSMGKTRIVALAHIAVWAAVQTLSELLNMLRGRFRADIFFAWWGRLRGFLSCMFWVPETAKPSGP